GDLADALHATDDDEPDEDREANAEGDLSPGALEEGQDVRGLRVALVGLEHVAAAEAPADAEDREEDGERPAEPVEASLAEADVEVAHRSAEDAAVVVLLAVGHREGALGELGRHPEEAGDDHPEDGAGAALVHGHGDARDVAEADRRRE